jgi:hypothetical protein
MGHGGGQRIHSKYTEKVERVIAGRDAPGREYIYGKNDPPEKRTEGWDGITHRV